MDNLYKKLMTYIGICGSILRDICFAFVHCHILYGIEIYANTASVHLNRLIISNNKLLHVLLLHVVQNKHYTYRVKDLYKNCNTIPNTDLHSLQLLVFCS